MPMEIVCQSSFHSRNVTSFVSPRQNHRQHAGKMIGRMAMVTLVVGLFRSFQTKCFVGAANQHFGGDVSTRVPVRIHMPLRSSAPRQQNHSECAPDGADFQACAQR
jgi:hypothetical protein